MIEKSTTGNIQQTLDLAPSISIRVARSLYRREKRRRELGKNNLGCQRRHCRRPNCSIARLSPNFDRQSKRYHQSFKMCCGSATSMSEAKWQSRNDSRYRGIRSRGFCGEQERHLKFDCPLTPGWYARDRGSIGQSSRATESCRLRSRHRPSVEDCQASTGVGRARTSTQTPAALSLPGRCRSKSALTPDPASHVARPPPVPPPSTE